MKSKVNSREERKQELQKLNEPPVLTILEEVGNAITHGVGAVLALAGFILLLLKSDTGMKVMASCFYGISLFILMLMSCLYHSFKSGSKVKRIWRRFDYSSIYLLIGGTFAPLYLGEYLRNYTFLYSMGINCFWNYNACCLWSRKVEVDTFYFILHYRVEWSYNVT